MTTELWYLFLTTILLTILWIPYIVGSVQTAGPLTPEEYRTGRNVEFPPWVRRANRAHINLVEQFGAFAGLVVIAHLTGVHDAVDRVVRHRLLLGADRPCDHLYFRLQPVQRPHGRLHHRLPRAAGLRVGDLRQRRRRPAG